MQVATQPLDPRIGTLMRDGALIYYGYASGYQNDPVIGTLNEVETALGLAMSPCPEPVPKPRPTARSASTLRRYEVTIVPSITLYGDSAIGTCVEYVDAANRREAENVVRRRLREVNGRYAPKYNVTARLDEY